MQNPVFQKARSRKSRFKQKSIFSITMRNIHSLQIFTVSLYKPSEHSPLGSFFQCCLKKKKKKTNNRDLTFRTAIVFSIGIYRVTKNTDLTFKTALVFSIGIYRVKEGTIFSFNPCSRPQSFVKILVYLTDYQYINRLFPIIKKIPDSTATTFAQFLLRCIGHN